MKTATIQPTKGLVLLKRLAPEVPTSSTIVIPETAQARSQRFEVLTVGRDVLDIHPKDIVLLGQYAGTTLEYAGQEVILVKADEVLAVVG